jgi:hypothetical protein
LKKYGTGKDEGYKSFNISILLIRLPHKPY